MWAPTVVRVSGQARSILTRNMFPFVVSWLSVGASPKLGNSKNNVCCACSSNVEHRVRGGGYFSKNNFRKGRASLTNIGGACAETVVGVALCVQHWRGMCPQVCTETTNTNQFQVNIDRGGSVLCVCFYDWTLWRSADRDISFFLVHPSPSYILPVPFGKGTAMWLYWDPEGTTSGHNLPSSKRPCPRRDKHGPGTWKSALGRSETPTFRRMLVKMLVAF